ncbi:MAG: metal ABC transporter ATP-binding protein [Aquificae bacterium]|nr:metal ABC transporter ATP-binding protein [Aquificota bacterium]
MNQILKVENLTVKIGNKIVLENINLSVNKGEIVAILGPNGGGKTTLIRTCLGFIKPYKGYVELLGTTPKKAVKTGKVGYLPQKSATPKNFPFSALDVVLLGLINKKLPKEKKIEIAKKYISFVGMSGFEDYPFSQLSGGQQQRISIARLLVAEPEIIFLDEPATGVDVVAQEGFYQFLRRLKEEKNITILMVSHDIGVVGTFVDKVAGLNKKLHYYGEPKGFFQKHILEELYGAEVKLLIHSPECISCEYFYVDTPTSKKDI